MGNKHVYSLKETKVLERRSFCVFSWLIPKEPVLPAVKHTGRPRQVAMFVSEKPKHSKDR
jgi:hypothetical protein